jgi:signal transduction histidine kinase
MWVSFGRHGLYRLAEGVWTPYGGRKDLPKTGVVIEFTDSLGRVWFGYTSTGLNGIFHVRRTEISQALKNPAYEVKGEHFGKREGLPGFAFQVRPLNTAIEGTDGRLWFATSGGVVWVEITQTENKAPPPPITIQSVSADDKNYQLASSLKFPAHTSSVQINYAAVSLSDPEAIRYRYKLQETDKDWHEMARANPVNYRNLAPGSYHFSVGATDANGVWSDKVATTDFTILPAFYQSSWFRALCVATAVAFLYMLYVLRLRQVAWQFNMRLEGRVAERTRIARDLHDTLLQSFQAALLKFHAVTYELSDRPEAKKELEKAIEQARAAIAEGRDAVQGLRTSTIVSSNLAQSIQTIGRELAADQGGEHCPELRVQVEGTSRDLVPLVRDEVYRIALEALRNAFRHAQARQIEVEFRYGQRQFRLRVRDDGRGIEQRLLERTGREGHYGLPGMQARLISGEFEVWSEPDSGTKIELTVPASVAYAKSPDALQPVASG